MSEIPPEVTATTSHLEECEKFCQDVFGVPLKEILEIEHSYPVTEPPTDWNLNANDILNQMQESSSDSDEETENVCTTSNNVIDFGTAHKHLEELKTFGSDRGLTDLLCPLDKIEQEVCKFQIQVISNKQSKITNYFNPSI